MTAKEKAKELFEKMYNEIQPDELGKDQASAQECALIAVNEILNVLWHTHKNEEVWRYYLEVKQEIINL